MWLGAHDLIQEGLWVWGWSGSGLELTSWKDGEPNDGGDGDEECVEMDGDDLLWNDDQCDNDKHFICQLRFDFIQLISFFFFFFFFCCVPQLYLWGSPLLGEIFAYVTVF